MLAHYLSLVQRLRKPAVLVSIGGAATVNPFAANALTTRDIDRLTEQCRASIDDARLRVCLVGSVSFSVTPLFDGRSDVEAALAIAEPIDALPRLLQQFQEPLRSFGLIAHELPLPVAVARPDGRFDFFNERWYATFGTDRRSEGREAFLTAFLPTERETVTAQWNSGTGTSAPFSFRARMRAGTLARCFHVDVRPMMYGARPIKWIVTLTDVDEEERALQALRLAAERDREIAASLQRKMLPTDLPRLGGLRCDVNYTPADSAMFVGGDWYDVFSLGDQRIGFTLGDVTGHGTDAAILMGSIRHVVRAAAREDDDPASVLARVNGLLCSEGTYASAVFGTLDVLTGDLAFANAGHLPPLLVAEDGNVLRLRTDGLLLGVEERVHLPVHRRRITLGDALIFYTDGLIEWNRAPDAAEARLVEQLAGWARRDFRESLASIRARLMDGNVDDVALMSLRLEARTDLDVVVPATPRNASRLRHAIERVLSRLAVEPERAAEITLATAEAVNNAAEHAYRGDLGPVHLRLRATPDAIGAEITDRGTWGERSSLDRGRGLEIIRAIAPDAFIRHDASGTTVLLRFPLSERLVKVHGSRPAVTASISHGS